MAVKLLCGAETGGTTELSTVSAGVTGQTTVASPGGAYAFASVGSTGASVFKQLTAISAVTLYITFKFQLSSVASTTGDYILFRMKSGTGTTIYLVLRQAGTGFTLTFGSGTNGVAVIYGTSSALTVNANTWYDIGVQVTAGAGTFYFNGTSVGSWTGQSYGAGNIAGPIDGMFKGGGTTTATMYFDDIVVDDATLQTGARVVSRQFYNGGTPTYDAWSAPGTGTKYGNVSETPTSSTLAVSSPTTAAILAQTFYINSFSNTETGKGTGTISSADTIIAAKLGAVLKTSSAASGGATCSLRSRLGGVDTDTSLTLTTADLFYTNDAYTTNVSIANLNAGQAGVVRASSSATQTLEDMWVIVAYIPSAVTPFIFPRRRTYLRR